MANLGFPTGGLDPPRPPDRRLLNLRRIPADQPFAIRPSIVKHAVPVVVVLAAQLVWLDFDGPDLALFGAAALLATALYLGRIAWVGPVLAVNAEGIWVKRWPAWQSRATFLPWSSIERIHLRRFVVDQRLCVVSRERHREHRRIEGAVHDAIFGTPFTVSLTFGNQPEDEVRDAIGRFSGGLVRID
jgi:hypothetical protein